MAKILDRNFEKRLVQKEMNALKAKGADSGQELINGLIKQIDAFAHSPRNFAADEMAAMSWKGWAIGLALAAAGTAGGFMLFKDDPTPVPTVVDDQKTTCGISDKDIGNVSAKISSVNKSHKIVKTNGSLLDPESCKFYPAGSTAAEKTELLPLSQEDFIFYTTRGLNATNISEVMYDNKTGQLVYNNTRFEYNSTLDKVIPVKLKGTAPTGTTTTPEATVTGGSRNKYLKGTEEIPLLDLSNYNKTMTFELNETAAKKVAGYLAEGAFDSFANNFRDLDLADARAISFRQNVLDNGTKTYTVEVFGANGYQSRPVKVDHDMFVAVQHAAKKA